MVLIMLQALPCARAVCLRCCATVAVRGVFSAELCVVVMLFRGVVVAWFGVLSDCGVWCVCVWFVFILLGVAWCRAVVNVLCCCEWRGGALPCM